MTDAPPRQPFTLTADQQNVLAWLNAGFNVFITGVAGTGKTAVLNYWIDHLPEGKTVGIAASTGIAATHIGGATLHSWLGATPERNTMPRLCNRTWMDKHAPRLKSVDALIIDEISMVDAELFTLAEGAHRAARESVQPWGGVQIVLVGDLGQLPPVEAADKGWCFQSPAWPESRIQVLELTQVMRQGDQRFADLLRRIRVGQVDDEVLRVLGSRVRAFDPNSEGTIRLVTHNQQADDINEERLALVPGKARTFRAQDVGQEQFLAQLRKHCLSPEVLNLKVGALVMFTKNETETGLWVNGTMGTVAGFPNPDTIQVRLRDGDVVDVHPATWDRKQWDDKTGDLRVVASRTQFPLRLAWAITIHKSQGTTLDRVSMNLSKTFEAGQAYVALSRCRTLEGINIEDWRGADSIIAHPALRGAAGVR